MKMKKVLLSVLTLTAAVSLAACGGGNDKKKANSDSAKDIAKAERVKKAELEVYLPKGKNTDYLVKSAELYNKKYGTEITLNPVDTPPSTGMVQKVTPKLVANEKMPDLIFLQDDYAGSVFSKFESKFYSSEDFGFVEKYGKDFYPAKMNMIKHVAKSGKTYGFPNDWGNAAMFYNDAAFKEAGVDIEKDVKTWDDFIEAGKKLKEKTGKNLVFMRDTGEVDLVKYLTEAQGVSEFDDKGNLNILDPAVIKAYEIIKKIDDADLVQYGNSKDYTNIGQKCGAMFVGGWEASYQKTDFPEDSGQWRIGKMPSVVEGKKATSPMSGGSSYYVPKNSNNPEAALQFIEFALTDKECLEEYLKLQGLPANTTAYDTEAAKAGAEYYGGQQILLTLNEISKDSIEGLSFPYSADLNNYIEAASYDIKQNGTPVKEALKKQADTFASKYNVKVNE